MKNEESLSFNILHSSFSRRQMNIVDGADEFLKPRNVGLLFFHEDPTRFMPGSQIEVVIFRPVRVAMN